ncbi:hypothetical protein C8F04DRAFT_1094115 [Mycena alexandri]|uniref:F-box domain-containing protein n=1 Tax=Mycena alexandri TaxID=1745969 RepID=A0AAD6X4U7_9AGAR|nr:hypothetical protein C8F04DRAFT_1094115 [Mycena alexandri]
MTLTQVPLDVILHVTSFLDLYDSVHLVTTCSTFLGLLSVKDFWLKTLDRLQEVHMQPLPAPIGVNVSELAIDALRKLALHAYSLKKNWASKRAIPVQLSTFSLGDEYHELCVIPGTHIIITNSPRLTRRLGYTIGHFIGHSPPFHLHGQSFIGVSSKSRIHIGITVVKVDYRNKNAVTLSKHYSNTLLMVDFMPMANPTLALDAQTIGMAFTSDLDDLSSLIYFKFQDGIMHHVPLGVRLGSHPNCLLHNTDFYVFGSGLDDPTTVLRPSHLDCNTMELLYSVPAADLICNVQGHSRLLHPGYGVFVVTRRSSDTLASFTGPRKTIHSVHFWNATHSGSRIDLGNTASYEHNSEMTGLVVGSSGRYATVIDLELGQRMRPTYRLGLIRYAAHPSPETSFHRLDTGSVHINYYTAVVALDDSLGVVYLTHLGTGATATLSVLSYA